MVSTSPTACFPKPERLQTEDGDATRFRAFEWDTTGSAGVLVNRSVWTSVEAFARRQFTVTVGSSNAAPPTANRALFGWEYRGCAGGITDPFGTEFSVITRP